MHNCDSPTPVFLMFAFKTGGAMSVGILEREALNPWVTYMLPVGPITEYAAWKCLQATEYL